MSDVLSPEDLAVLKNHTHSLSNVQKKIKELSAQIRNLRKESKTIQHDLCTFMKLKNLKNEKLQVGGVHFKYAEQKKTDDRINRKNVYEKLLFFFKSKEKTWLFSASPEEKAEAATSQIYDNRSIHYEEYIKTTFPVKKK